MFKIGDKVKLDDFGLKQWPNPGTFEVMDVVKSDEYGSGFGLLTTLSQKYIDADYFIIA
jgi:hypothetical protein